MSHRIFPTPRGPERPVKALTLDRRDQKAQAKLPQKPLPPHKIHNWTKGWIATKETTWQAELQR
jgi:hypothetical protein